MSKAGKELKESYRVQATEQWKHKPTDEDLVVVIKLYFGDNRKRDIDNFHKLSLDALSGIIWEDDGQIQTMTVNKSVDKTNPRIEVNAYRQ